MSYDVYFLPAHFKDNWDAAMEAFGDDRETAGQDGWTVDAAVWARVERALTARWASLESTTDSSYSELRDPELGLQISLTAEDFTMTVPYWYSGDAATEVADRMRSIAELIEEATGLIAYDPQSDRAFLDPLNDPATRIADITVRMPQIVDTARRSAGRAGLQDRLLRWWRS